MVFTSEDGCFISELNECLISLDKAPTEKSIPHKWYFSIHQTYWDLFSGMLHFGSSLQRLHSADQCPALNSGLLQNVCLAALVNLSLIF